MKKLMFCLLLATSNCGFTQIMEPFFMDNAFEEFVPDQLSAVYHYCKDKRQECSEHQGIFDISYGAKYEAYDDVIKYINSL